MGFGVSKPGTALLDRWEACICDGGVDCCLLHWDGVCRFVSERERGWDMVKSGVFERSFLGREVVADLYLPIDELSVVMVWSGDGDAVLVWERT